MKKILSFVLALAMIVSCVSMVTFMTNAANTTYASGDQLFETIDFEDAVVGGPSAQSTSLITNWWRNASRTDKVWGPVGFKAPTLSNNAAITNWEIVEETGKGKVFKHTLGGNNTACFIDLASFGTYLKDAYEDIGADTLRVIVQFDYKTATTTGNAGRNDLGAVEIFESKNRVTNDMACPTNTTHKFWQIGGLAEKSKGGTWQTFTGGFYMSAADVTALNTADITTGAANGDQYQIYLNMLKSQETIYLDNISVTVEDTTLPTYESGDKLFATVDFENAVVGGPAAQPGKMLINKNESNNRVFKYFTIDAFNIVAYTNCQAQAWTAATNWSIVSETGKGNVFKTTTTTSNVGFGIDLGAMIKKAYTDIGGTKLNVNVSLDYKISAAGLSGNAPYLADVEFVAANRATTDDLVCTNTNWGFQRFAQLAENDQAGTWQTLNASFVMNAADIAALDVNDIKNNYKVQFNMLGGKTEAPVDIYLDNITVTVVDPDAATPTPTATPTPVVTPTPEPTPVPFKSGDKLFDVIDFEDQTVGAPAAQPATAFKDIVINATRTDKHYANSAFGCTWQTENGKNTYNTWEIATDAEFGKVFKHTTTNSNVSFYWTIGEMLEKAYKDIDPENKLIVTVEFDYNASKGHSNGRLGDVEISETMNRVSTDLTLGVPQWKMWRIGWLETDSDAGEWMSFTGTFDVTADDVAKITSGEDIYKIVLNFVGGEDTAAATIMIDNISVTVVDPDAPVATPAPGGKDPSTGTGDVLPVALIATVAIATIGFVVVAKKKED